MNNVIAFPDKVFPQWGAIAQAIVAYLRHLGATNGEAKEIVGRLQARWEQLGVVQPAAALRLIPESTDGEGSEASQAARAEQAMQVSRHWKSENARTLLEFAKLEYQQSRAG